MAPQKCPVWVTCPSRRAGSAPADMLARSWDLVRHIGADQQTKLLNFSGCEV
jgi:hypothetical protein